VTIRASEKWPFGLQWPVPFLGSPPRRRTKMSVYTHGLSQRSSHSCAWSATGHGLYPAPISAPPAPIAAPCVCHRSSRSPVTSRRTHVHSTPPRGRKPPVSEPASWPVLTFAVYNRHLKLRFRPQHILSSPTVVYTAEYAESRLE